MPSISSWNPLDKGRLELSASVLMCDELKAVVVTRIIRCFRMSLHCHKPLLQSRVLCLHLPWSSGSENALPRHSGTANFLRFAWLTVGSWGTLRTGWRVLWEEEQEFCTACLKIVSAMSVVLGTRQTYGMLPVMALFSIHSLPQDVGPRSEHTGKNRVCPAFRHASSSKLRNGFRFQFVEAIDMKILYTFLSCCVWVQNTLYSYIVWKSNAAWSVFFSMYKVTNFSSPCHNGM
jgi:hypothetical protein